MGILAPRKTAGLTMTGLKWGGFAKDPYIPADLNLLFEASNNYFALLINGNVGTYVSHPTP